MGAELHLVTLPAANLTDERRERLHEIVSGLSEQELQQLDPDDWDAGGPEELRRQLHEYVSALRGPDERRDVVPLHAPVMPYELWVTGGMSWGDDPTDIYDCFCCSAHARRSGRNFRSGLAPTDASPPLAIP